MTISVIHTFVSAKADGSDTTLVQPSDWNDQHTISLAAGKILGRDTSGAGAVQELPLAFTAAYEVTLPLTTGSMIGAKGTTAQRPGSPVAGMERWNTSLVQKEIYDTDWRKFMTDAASATATALAIASTVRGNIHGLTLSTAGSSATFGIAVGIAMNSTYVAAMALASAYTKTTSAWAVGTSNGALDTGAIANSTWYHVYLIQRVDTGVVDVLISLSATAPTMPTNYTLFRRIGSLLTNGSAQWVAFQQIGDEFRWLTPVLDGSNVSLSTTYTNITISSPLGVVVQAFGSGRQGPGYFMHIRPLFASDGAPSDTVSPLGTLGAGGSATFSPGTWRVFTDTSSRIKWALSGSVAGNYLTTAGWIDRRGQDD